MKNNDTVRHTVNLQPEIAQMAQDYQRRTGRNSLAATLATLIGIGLKQMGYDFSGPAVNPWGGARNLDDE